MTPKITDDISWELAQQISESKLVEEALHAFNDSACEDNAVGLIQYVLNEYNRRRRETIIKLFTDAPDSAVISELYRDKLSEPVSESDPPRGMQDLLMDGKRFRLLGDLFVAIGGDTQEDRERMDVINAVVDQLNDDLVPGLKMLREIVDTLYAHNLLKEIEQ